MESEDFLRRFLSKNSEVRLELDLSRRGLTSIPEGLPLLTEVEVLKLSHNPLKTLPQSLGNLVHLKQLELGKCGLTAAGSLVLTQLTSLVELDLSENVVKTLPQDFSKLKLLKKLDLSSCGITELGPGIGELTSLEVLKLSGNKIKTLPQDLSNLKLLMILYLRNCELTELGPGIGELTSLKELNLSGNKIKTLPQDLSNLKLLIKLNLRNCKLRELGPGIGELTSLKELNLSGNKIKTLPQDLSNLKLLMILDLSNCELTELWPGIGELTSLKELNLSGNKIKTLPQDLSNLKLLMILDLSNCELTELWPGIGELTSLKVLYLSGKKIKTLPQDLSNLKLLMILDLSNCELTELGPGIGELTSLKVLNLSGNKIKTLPQDLSNLKLLIKLNLSNCELTELGPGIGELTSLKELNLSGNKIKTLPQDLSNLKLLMILDLSNCELTELWPGIGELTSLKVLYLSGKKIKTLPQDLSNLKLLMILDLSNCELTELWPGIGELTSLKELNLSGNKIKTLPQDLSKLKLLKELNLSSCGITELGRDIGELTSLVRLNLEYYSGLEYLPFSVLNLKHLCFLHVDGTSLRQPPLEVCKQGVVAVFSYLADIRLAKAVHQKVVLLGCSGAGKTSLAHTLVNGIPSCVQREDRTIVLDRIAWEATMGEKNLSICMIDFGGSEWYKIVHHLFIDGNALFFVVVNLAEYSHDNFERDIGSWLKLLLTRVSGPHWRLVATHADECTADDIDAKCKAVKESVMCVYEREGLDIGESFEILVISSETMYGVSKVQEEVMSFVNLNGKVIPESWLKLFKQLQSPGNKGRPYFRFEEVMAVDEKIRREGAKNLFARLVFASTSRKKSSLESIAFFQDIGAILWYRYTPQLSQFIFHDPEYLTSLLKAVFTERLETESLRYANFMSTFSEGSFDEAKNNLLERGVISRDLLKCLWKRKHKDLSEEVVTAMIDLFMQMDFCYALDTVEDQVTSIRFPWFLADEIPDDPELQQILRGPSAATESHRITFEYEFLSICPPPMYEKFSVRMHRKIHDQTNRRDWKGGFQAEIYESRLVVQKFHRALETVISFTVEGENVLELWKVLIEAKEVMQNVMAEWPGLKPGIHYRTFILCPHCVRQCVKRPFRYPGENVDKSCPAEQLWMKCQRSSQTGKVPACLVFRTDGES